MESEKYRLQLGETKEKLLNLTGQLDNVLKYNCKLGVGMDYVIATINELKSLIEWTSDKKELKADSSIIFQKLQQLERIQKDLEKTATESEKVRFLAEHHNQNLENNYNDAITFELCDKMFQENQSPSSHNSLNSSEFPTSPKSLQSNDATIEENSSLSVDFGTSVDSETLDVEDRDSQTLAIICSNNQDNEDLGPNISEDEGLGEESRRGDSTGPSSFIEIQDSLSDINLTSADIQRPVNNNLIVAEPGGEEKSKEWTGGQEIPRNSLDICLCAIGNLRESLIAKENELLKLSAVQNDQKQITALQEIIINFHKDTTNLKSQLEKTKKENESLKEQVLELEEAENDARLQAQKLGEKLVFLQEKDSHFQAELSETKQSLEKCFEELRVKKVEEHELRSQMKYMEALVQKYEDQIKTMEIVEIALRKKLIEQEDEFRAVEKSIIKSETGTQTYDPYLKKVKVFDEQGFHDSTDTRGSAVLSREETNFSELNGHTDRCVEVSVQVSPKSCPTSFVVAECAVQTDDIGSNQFRNETHLEDQGGRSKLHSENAEEPSDVAVTLSNIECPIQKELLKRLHQLVEEDAHLQQQLHYVDQINLTLWKKLHNLEFHIGECKRKNISEDCASDSCIDSECDISSSSRPVSREQTCIENLENSKCESPTSSRGIIACLDQSENEIKERLVKLEQINASFEKELELREKLYSEKERKYSEWVQTEQRFIVDLKRLSDERDSLIDQVTQLEKEKKELAIRVEELQVEINSVKEKQQIEVENIKAKQAEMSAQLQQKVEQLLFKEREHLKQITNLKLERSKSSDKTESEKLKASYVELQLELKRTRDEMRRKEDDFRVAIDESRSKHTFEEARLISELEMLRNKNSTCDEMIRNYQTRQNELMDILKQKESDLKQARLEYKKNMDATEEEHRAIEAELKSQLRRMEEGTAVATRALAEERMRLEKELQENIDDLRSKEENYKARIAELESNVSHLHDELHRITGDLDSGFESEMGSDGISSFRREKLLNQLRELRDREAELREKLDEMEQKEAAYRETLEHADRIVASVEQGYKNKIEELEISERNLKQRVGHLEEVETRLRGALHKERRSSDGRKPDDLVVELLEAEARESGLKEKLEALEQLQRSSMNKVKDLEKLREKLETQLSDRDEISSNLQKTQQELELARKSLAKLKKSESDLKSTLQQTEGLLATTESQMSSKIQTIEEEKKGLEETINELRAQVRELKNKLERICDDEEEERMSVAIPNQTTPHISIQAMQDVKEPDYVDVDDIGAEPSSQKARHSLQGKMIAESSLSLSSSRRESNSLKSNKAMQIKQPRIPSDSIYDSARQNLEDCMLRAMAAMKKDMQNKVRSDQPENEENDYDEVLPRPTNFRVVQQVGSDTLLVGWNYVNPSVLEGFEIYVNGQLHETVYTPDRAKALISGLNLKRPLHLSICAFSRYGQMSEPTNLELPCQEKNNGFYFQDEDDDEDEDGLFDDSIYEKNRPYSMEW